MNSPTNGGYDTKDPSYQGAMGEPLNRLDDASRTCADENQGLEQERCEEKVWEIPRNTKEPAAPIHISRKAGRSGGRGAHIYRLNAKCQPQKKK